MDEILKQTLLYDFYGELLTDHQKEIYEQVVLEDYSLSEIAKDAGISRQGVHDMIKRCNKTLEGYEEKLHLVEKFMFIKQKVHEINLLLEDYEDQNEAELIQKVRKTFMYIRKQIKLFVTKRRNPVLQRSQQKIPENIQ